MNRAPRILARLLLAACCLHTASAADVAEQAEAALRDGMGATVIAPLQDALRKAPAADHARLAALLARAQLAAGRPEAALKTLDGIPGAGSTEATVLRASALAALGNTEKASALLDPLVSSSPDAALQLARIHLEQGNAPAAFTLLEPLISTPESLSPATARLAVETCFAATPPETTEALLGAIEETQILAETEIQTFRGRLRLKQDRPSEAAEIFRNVLTDPNLPGPIRDNARIGLARSLVTLGVENRAREVLREALITTPDAYNTGEMMALWTVLEQKAGSDPATDLRSWAGTGSGRRAIEARLQLARLELNLRRTDTAITLLDEVLTAPGATPTDALRARLLLAEALIASGQTGDALELLDAIARETDEAAFAYRLADLRGRALAAAGSHHQAHDAFAEASRAATTPEETATAATNRLLTALAADDLPLARQSYELLRTTSPGSPDLVRWSFLIAAAEARDGNIDSMGALARRSPSVDYAFQAKLALAEWRLSRGEPAAAERILRTAGDDADTEPRAAALGAAEIFAADNAGSRTREELVQASRDFLEQHGAAPEAVDVRFKLGELYSRGGDHTAAESVFAELARSVPDAESAQLAKFLAAQSGARSMSAEGTTRALAWFDEIAQSNSPLRHRARFEQASVLVRDGRFADALTLYDRILSANPPTEVLHAAMMEKGDTLFAQGAGQTDKFAEAAGVYAAVASDTQAPPDWRDQAACKQANALARLGQSEAALAVYRSVLDRPDEAGSDPFWFYKAGLEAARLLEEQQDWPAAIAVYDKLSSARGPQSEAIEQRARRLRLEHFIWEN